MKAKRVTNGDGSPYGVRFDCPGCKSPHVVPTPPSPNAWGFNGSLERPTLTPSILLRTKDWDEWDDAANRPRNVRDVVCHSFVTDGRIQFLGDCTHALAGQTVDLPDIAEAP